MVEDRLPTRETLLIRLRDPADDASWTEFAEIYTPLLFAYCRKRELKHADASDIVQEVMRSVSLAIRNFQYDPAKGKFKAWLFTAVRNTILTHRSKQARRPLPGGDSVAQAMDAEPSEQEQDDWETDYQRQLLAWALEKIRPEFAPRIWRAFEATALEDRIPSEVAAEIEMSTNAIAVAKHRVLKRLREKAHSIDADKWEQEMIAREAGRGTADGGA